MTRAQRKQIEREFYNYKQNRDKAANYVASHAFDGFGVDYSEPRVKSSPGNGVERNMIQALGEEERAWKWCVVFQKTMERFRWTQKDELMRRRYIEREHEAKTCMGIGIERRTYYYWINEILETSFLWANNFKLLF